MSTRAAVPSCQRHILSPCFHTLKQPHTFPPAVVPRCGRRLGPCRTPAGSWSTRLAPWRRCRPRSPRRLSGSFRAARPVSRWARSGPAPDVPTVWHETVGPKGVPAQVWKSCVPKRGPRRQQEGQPGEAPDLCFLKPSTRCMQGCPLAVDSSTEMNSCCRGATYEAMKRNKGVCKQASCRPHLWQAPAGPQCLARPSPAHHASAAMRVSGPAAELR